MSDNWIDADSGWSRFYWAVQRAKTREHWVLEEVTSADAGPHELLHTAMEAQTQWVIALMYLLGWRGPATKMYDERYRLPKSRVVGAKPRGKSNPTAPSSRVQRAARVVRNG